MTRPRTLLRTAPPVVAAAVLAAAVGYGTIDLADAADPSVRQVVSSSPRTGAAPEAAAAGPTAEAPAPASATEPSPAVVRPVEPPSVTAPTAVQPAAAARPVPPATAAGPTTVAEPTSAVRVVLRPDGLGVNDGGSSTSSLPFGTDAATVRAVTDRALSAGGLMATPDCGPGSATVQHEGLFLQLQDDVFVGWSTGSPGLATGDGIGVGSTLADLRASFGTLSVSSTTLGVEWTTGDGGVVGFLDGTSSDSVVIGTAAGVRCLAR